MSERLLARDDFFFCLLLLASFSVLFPESGDDSSAAAEVEGAPVGRWLLGIMAFIHTGYHEHKMCWENDTKRIENANSQTVQTGLLQFF